MLPKISIYRSCFCLNGPSFVISLVLVSASDILVWCLSSSYIVFFNGNKQFFVIILCFVPEGNKNNYYYYYIFGHVSV
jgi:hypothetical protein